MQEEDLGKQDGYLGFQPSPEREAKGGGRRVKLNLRVKDRRY
jgi:hypothetical protein